MKEDIKALIFVIGLPLSFIGYIVMISYLFNLVTIQVNRIVSNLHNQQILLFSSFIPYLFFGVGLVSILVLYINLLKSGVPKKHEN